MIKSLNKPSQSMGDLSKKGNPLALDPLTKSRLMKELKFYQEEKLKNEILLDKLVKALDYTESQLKEVEGEKLDFGLSNPSNSEESKNEKLNL